MMKKKGLFFSFILLIFCARSSYAHGDIKAPATVEEGGVVVIECTSSVKTVTVFVGGPGTTTVPVVNGRAKYQLPPGVRGGARILISDEKYPKPSAAEVRVVSN